MDGLLAGIAALSVYNPDAGKSDLETAQRQALQLTARMPTLAANLARIRGGQDLVLPRGGLSLAGGFLYMLLGGEPEPGAARALDQVLLLHADHEFNASTFAGRIAASTLSDMHGALLAAIATLAGPLHGGASEQVMAMLEEVGDPERAEAYVLERLAAKEKVMGFGHRVYKTEDPRASHLRRMARELGEQGGDTRWFDISQRIEEVMNREKGLNANVDFYSASVYRSLGIPVELFTAMFVCGRVAGYTAHFLEQYADNRLIRPRSLYVGFHNRTWVPLDQRGS
jgi:citrate synthase